MLGRNGIDDAGMDVISSVHVSDPLGQPWENAAWISTQMVYGEGGHLFRAGPGQFHLIERLHGSQPGGAAAFRVDLIWDAHAGAARRPASVTRDRQARAASPP